MSETTVTVRANVHVSIIVPYTIEVDVEDFEAWRAARGYVGPSWVSDLTECHDDVIRYLEALDSDSGGEVLRDVPEPNIREHEIWSTDINEIEVMHS